MKILSPNISLIAETLLVPELLMTVNTVGQANGILRVWLDGTRILNYTDRIYRTAGNASGFFARSWASIWGGTGGTAKTRNDRIHIDHLYVSGVAI